MKSMRISDAVAQALGTYGYLKLPLSLGVANYSALARLLTPAVEERLQRTVPPGAVIIALQRIAKRLARDREARPLVEAVARSKLRIRTGHVLVHLAPDLKLRNEIVKLVQLAESSGSERIYVVSRREELSLVMGRTLYERLLADSAGTHVIIDAQEDLAVLSAVFPKKAIDTPGYLNYFLNELAYHGVNILAIFSTRHVVSFVVSDGQAALAYERMLFLINSCAKAASTMGEGKAP